MSTALSPERRGTPPATITAPRPPTSSTRPPFPFAATVAPVVVSVALFAITRSPFALLFAVLGPVVALASLVDGLVSSRRRSRREWRRFELEAATTRTAVKAALDAERDRRLREHPATAELVTRARDPGAWSPSGPAGVEVRLGRGTVESDLRIDRGTGRESDPRIDAVIAALIDHASWLDGAPVCLDPREGVGFCGSTVTARAAARAFAMRLARSADPAVFELRVGGDAAWRWLDDLPHAQAPAVAVVPVRSRPEGSETVEFVPRHAVRTSTDAVHPGADATAVLRIAVAARTDGLPRWCRTVVDVDAAGTSSVRGSGEAASDAPVRCDLASVAEAVQYARTLRVIAEAEGRVSSTLLPDRVGFAVLDHDTGGAERGADAGLVARLGAAAEGEWSVDLVADGPHAVVGGTTGSGKSELLVTWVLALAARYPPERVTFLLVDFKGGSAFDALGALPHRVGTITDLDPATARRALESLRAEIMFRETALAKVGARSVDDSNGTTVLARLVIVVDEFAALASGFPELHTLFVDLAARGRSLGVHLVLCTQRPAASLRDAILANCTLRISLRVNDAGDSAAIIGTGAAALLPRHPPGRALVSIGGAAPCAVQVAVAAEGDTETVARRWPRRAVRRPWCEPLPALIRAHDLPAVPLPSHAERAEYPLDDAVVFGLLDLPQEQRQAPAVWRPGRDGPLLVLGGHGSGKSTALATIARGLREAVIVPADVEGAWDLVRDTVRSIEHDRRAESGQILFFDDIDALLARFGRDHELEFAGLLSRLLREGPRAGTSSVLSAAGSPSMLQASIEARLILRMPTRQEHLVLGGSSSDFDEKLLPGAGRWRGDRVQVGHTPVSAPPAAPAPARWEPLVGRATAVISSRPGSLRARWAPAATSGRIRLVDLAALPRGSGDPALVVADRAEHLVLLGDPESWQSSTLLGVARARIPMIFDGCSAAEFRMVTRTRRLPPALETSSGHGWLLAPDDRLSRIALPESIA